MSETNNQDLNKKTVLELIKTNLGNNYDDFDAMLLTIINGHYAKIMDLSFVSEVLIDKDTTMEDLVKEPNTKKRLEVQQALTLRTQLTFDPPQNEYSVRAIKEMADEVEARLSSDSRREVAIFGEVSNS